LPRNWPRLIREGNWSAVVAGPLNGVISVVLLGVLSTIVVGSKKPMLKIDENTRSGCTILYVGKGAS
jgi:hypothetical protein